METTKENTAKENTPKMVAHLLLSAMPDDAGWDDIVALVLHCHAYRAHRRARGQIPVDEPPVPTTSH